MIAQGECAGRSHSMQVSHHGQRRMKDRSIPASVIDALIDFGDRAPSGGGAETCYFTKRSWRAFAAYLGTQARHFERYRAVYAILSGDGKIITVCWRH